MDCNKLATSVTSLMTLWSLFSFQLFPGYRGFLVDSVKTLHLLDEVRISADERHMFKGISEAKGMTLSSFLSVLEYILFFLLFLF